MTIEIYPSDLKNKIFYNTLNKASLNRYLEENGRFPGVSIISKPLDGSAPTRIDKFMSYTFTSNIMIPVDTFSFTFASPDSPPLTFSINDGDIITVTANDKVICTGIIDVTETEVDGAYGEKSTLSGRDVMGQLEDQDAISLSSKPIYSYGTTIEQGVKDICRDTRITQFSFNDLPPLKDKALLQSEPGESKISTLQRFLEPYNILAWSGPSGELVVGKPNMQQKKSGDVICDRSRRISNVLSARVRRSSTNIGNVVAGIWTGQERLGARIPPEQILYNGADGPQRLRKYGYIVPRAVVTSSITAPTAQGQSDANAIVQAGGANLLQANVKRQIARENFNEILFECVVAGHYDEFGEPYRVDTVFQIQFDRGNLFENMYLFAVQYQLTPQQGQTTVLSFCRFGSMVADVVTP